MAHTRKSNFDAETKNIVDEGEVQQEARIDIEDKPILIDMMAALYDIFESMERPLACHDILPNAPNLGLTINGFGTIGFPLSERDVAVIVAASIQKISVSGLAQVPRAQSAGGNAWRVPAELLSLDNPAWKTTLTAVLKKVYLEMRINSSGMGLKARLSSLVLFETGSCQEQCEMSV